MIKPDELAPLPPPYGSFGADGGIVPLPPRSLPAAPGRPRTPAELEARLEAEGYDPQRDATAGGCGCDPPLE